MRETVVSAQSSATYKSKVHWEAVCGDTYQDADREVEQ
jgi:hypothetical protein